MIIKKYLDSKTLDDNKLNRRYWYKNNSIFFIRFIKNNWVKNIIKVS